jgi:RNA polymerase sigma factor for flagellar operon FliA
MQSATAITDIRALEGTKPRSIGRVERDELIKAHMYLVHSIVHDPKVSSLGKGVELEDLVAYGSQGLVEAANRFDGSKGIPFAAFARHRISGAIVDGIRTQHRLGRRAYERLQADPTAGDVHFVEFDQWTEESGDARWNGRRMAQVPFAEDDSLQIVVAAELRHLPARQRRLVALCFNEGKTLSQAGAEMGFGRSWASKLLTGALATLKAAVDSCGVRF